MTDPNFYREYECNIDCPKLKASKRFRCPDCILGNVTADSLKVTSINQSGITTITGSSAFGTVHTITPTQLPNLGNKECNGEITFNLNNDTYVNTSLAVIVKTKGVILQTLIYQRVGNFTSVVLSYSGNNLVLTVSPAGTCRWIFRGI